MLHHCSTEYQPTLKKVTPRELHYIPLALADREEDSVYRIGAISKEGKYEPLIKGYRKKQSRVRASNGIDLFLQKNLFDGFYELSNTYQVALNIYQDAITTTIPVVKNEGDNAVALPGKFRMLLLSRFNTKKDVDLLDRFNQARIETKAFVQPSPKGIKGLTFHSLPKDADLHNPTKERAAAKAKELAQAQKTAALTATILSYNPIQQVLPLPPQAAPAPPKAGAGNRFAQIKEELQQLKEQSIINPSAQVCLQIKQLIIELRQLVRQSLRRLEFMLRIHTRPIYQEPSHPPLRTRSLFRHLYKYMNDVTGCEDDHAVLPRRNYSQLSFTIKALFQCIISTSSSAYWMKLSTIRTTSYLPMK